MSMASAQLTIPHDEQEIAEKPGWLLQKLNIWHKNVASLIAQGIPRATIAAMMDCTPTYVSMLAKQPLLVDYIKDLSEFAGLQLEAQFAKSVEAISETLENGDHKSKMQAARLQLEATKRIGSKAVEKEKLIDTNARLASLAEKLLALQDNSRNIVRAQVEVIQNGQQSEKDAEEGEWSEQEGPALRSDQSAQDAGDGTDDPNPEC